MFFLCEELNTLFVLEKAQRMLRNYFVNVFKAKFPFIKKESLLKVHTMWAL
jgi:hypothetical protein